MKRLAHRTKYSLEARRLCPPDAKGAKRALFIEAKQAAAEQTAPDAHLQEIIAPLSHSDIALLLQVAWATLPANTRARALLEPFDNPAERRYARWFVAV